MGGATVGLCLPAPSDFRFRLVWMKVEVMGDGLV